ncbi:probable plastid-lipid-associated protein 13 chloroplastic [Phtheirospermum japonicum]|uniref:Probable plastid-lipid-associated protein 13 chloroplastic n=1 Tax=Phtheirospermum japonicum TaxID=374723 RepID=A0A830B4B0_9LAMI|nr:probable plastid-lipid-associated protein 13 chloroplastic [Phtheirospermum japonicum]
MACSISVQTLLLSSKLHSRRAPSFPPSTQLYFLENNHKNGGYTKFMSGKSRKMCRAMVQQGVQGSSAAYAKEMERLSAKESLLLAFKDAGGFGALVTGKTTDMQRIDVNERIVGLERLNPTPRPTTSPYLEGRWNFEWFGSGSPGLFAARFLFERFPTELANLLKVDIVIKDGYTKAAANNKGRCWSARSAYKVRSWTVTHGRPNN